MSFLGMMTGFCLGYVMGSAGDGQALSFSLGLMWAIVFGMLFDDDDD